MSYACTPSPLNPLREALGRCKADRERCDAEIDKLVVERERIATLLPELRRRQNARSDKRERLEDQLHIYDVAIRDLEDQFGDLLGAPAALLAAATVRDDRYADAAVVGALPPNARVVVGERQGAAHILHPIVGFVDLACVPPPPAPAAPRSSPSRSAASGSGSGSASPSEAGDEEPVVDLDEAAQQ